MKHYYVITGYSTVRFLALLLVFSLLVSCAAPNKTELIDQARSALLAGDSRTAIIHVHNLLRDEPNHVEARLLRADIALAMNNGALAEKDLLRAKDLGMPPGEVVVRLGKAMLLQDAFSRVIADIHIGATNDGQTRIRILLMRGDAYLGLGRLDSAAQAFRDVANADPESPHAMVGLGRVAFARGNTDAALDSLSRALTIAPDNFEILLAYARFHFDAGNLELAKEAFLKVLEMQPVETIRQDSFATISGLFETHMRLGETAQARALALEALATEPGHPLVHYLLGEHALRTGQTQAATEHFQRTLSAFPNHIGALSQLGSLSLAEGRPDMAETYLRQALELDEDNPGLRMQLARIMLLRREGDAALEVLAGIMDDSDNVPELLAIAGSAARLSKRNSGWLSYFEQAVSADPNNPEWQLELARAYLAEGLPDKSLEALAGIAESERISNPYNRLLFEAYRRSGDIEAALAVGATLRDSNPGNIGIELLIGELHLDTGDLRAARAIMDRALDASPATAAALLYAGKVETRAANFDQAESYFRDAYTLQPDNLKAVASMVALAQRRGDKARAVEIFESARITNPDSLLPLVGLVSLYLSRDDVNQAYEIASEAIDLREDDPRALLALGVTQMRREEFREAIITLEQASLKAPDSALIKFTLAQGYQAKGKPHDALFFMKRAIELAPRKLSYVIAGIELNLSLERFDESARLAQAVIEADPGNADAHRLLGEALIARGNFADAAQAFGQAAIARPSEEMVIRQFRALLRAGFSDAGEVLTDWLETHVDHWRVRLTLAGLLHRSGEITKAIEHYYKILETVPDNAVVLNNLAVAYDTVDDARSVEIAERAHRLRPHIGAFTDTLGWLLVKKGETARGNALLRKAVQQLPSAPEIRYHLAAGLAQNGEVAEARLLLSELVDSAVQFDGLAEARVLLDRL